MIQKVDEKVARTAAALLSVNDPILGVTIANAPLCDIRPNKDYYQALVGSIISQQLSTYATAAIEKRFQDLFDGIFPNPEQILTVDVETLRSIGFSRGKATYVLDLAQHIVDGKVRFDHLDALRDDEVIAELTAVKGIGVWTAHMFLMFCMGRADILPVGDLGIKNGIKRLYGLDEVPTPDDIVELAKHNGWHPYASIASWYIWHSLDNKPKV